MSDGRQFDLTSAEERQRAKSGALPRLSDDVYAAIKKRILSALIVHGERLYETVVAEEFAASRTPVREALMRLLEEGLVERNGRAYTVRELSVDEFLDIYVVRQRLESLSVSLAAVKITEVQLQEMGDLVSAMDEAVRSSDKLQFNLLDSQFHMAIAECAGNHTLVDTLFKIHEKVRLVRNSMSEFVSRLPLANDEHELILKALSRREPLVAAAEMDAHIQSTIEYLRKVSSSKMSAKST